MTYREAWFRNETAYIKSLHGPIGDAKRVAAIRARTTWDDPEPSGTRRFLRQQVIDWATSLSFHERAMMGLTLTDAPEWLQEHLK
jgi:hypothetical protein